MTKFIISCSVALACVCTVLAINRGGMSARFFGKSCNLSSERPTIYLLKNTSDVYRLWEKKKVRGRVVVHLGKFLHYVRPEFDPEYTVPRSNYPLRVHEPHEFTDGEVNFKNFLWTAMDVGVVRKTYNVMPLRDFQQRFGLGTANNTPSDVVEHDNASARIITTRIPPVREQVLLNIDASYFGTIDISAFENTLRNAGLSVDIVTVCLAEDSPDVSEAERRKAHEFVRKLSEFASIVEPGNSI
jgi:hypothetical protein